MKYFVFHEFQNSSRNTDLYDTISSHKDSVFVPLYMSKPATDAKGRRFVIVLQVAPYDVLSIHATNWGSAGPGMEVAKNASDPVEPLQNLAGILVAGDELEQRRLAGAIGPDHGDTAPGADHQADVAEDVLRGVALRHAGEGHEAHGAPSMVAPRLR
jgi:hypothetical protein